MTYITQYCLFLKLCRNKIINLMSADCGDWILFQFYSASGYQLLVGAILVAARLAIIWCGHWTLYRPIFPCSTMWTVNQVASNPFDSLSECYTISANVFPLIPSSMFSFYSLPASGLQGGRCSLCGRPVSKYSFIVLSFFVGCVDVLK